MALSLRDRFALLPRHVREQWLGEQGTDVLEEMAREEWWWVHRPEQVPPEGRQLIDLYLAGRGAGKTRAGAEWIVDRSLKYPFSISGAPTERLIVAATLGDARVTCLEGESGVLRILDRRKIPFTYKQSPRPMVIFTQTGAKIYCFGADTPNVARGMNAADAWLDEIIKWDYSYESWKQGIMLTLRTNIPQDHPRAFVTTTPKPIKLLQEWLARTDGSVHMITGSTFDNAANLNEYFLQELRTTYEGTELGAQELYGQMLDAMKGALFKRNDLNNYRVDEAPELIGSVVGVDPSLVGDKDAMGVVVMGRSRDDHLYVLADETIQAAGRDAALHCWRVLIKYDAGTVVYEENLGKKWMEQVFKDAWFELVKLGEAPAGTSPPMRGIDAKLGKKTRAEPVAMRSEQGRMHMVGHHGELEDELVLFTSWDGKESPNRLDAMVHAGRHHMEMERNKGNIINPDDMRPEGFGNGFASGIDFGW